MMSMSGASAARVMVAVASAVFRLNPVRARQAPVRKWVIGSKVEERVLKSLGCDRVKPRFNEEWEQQGSDPCGDGKIGARGPMGLEELTTYKWVGIGSGQLRG